MSLRLLLLLLLCAYLLLLTGGCKRIGARLSASAVVVCSADHFVTSLCVLSPNYESLLKCNVCVLLTTITSDSVSTVADTSCVLDCPSHADEHRSTRSSLDISFIDLSRRISCTEVLSSVVLPSVVLPVVVLPAVVLPYKADNIQVSPKTSSIEAFRALYSQGLQAEVLPDWVNEGTPPVASCICAIDKSSSAKIKLDLILHFVLTVMRLSCCWPGYTSMAACAASLYVSRNFFAIAMRSSLLIERFFRTRGQFVSLILQKRVSRMLRRLSEGFSVNPIAACLLYVLWYSAFLASKRAVSSRLVHQETYICVYRAFYLLRVVPVMGCVWITLVLGICIVWYVFSVSSYPFGRGEVHTLETVDSSKRVVSLRKYWEATSVAGGGRPNTVTGSLLKAYHTDRDPSYDYSVEYVFVRHIVPGGEEALPRSDTSDHTNGRNITCKLPLYMIAQCTNRKDLDAILETHGVDTSKYVPTGKLVRNLRNHSCSMCTLCFTEFRPYEKLSQVQKNQRYLNRQLHSVKRDRYVISPVYPPKPPTSDLMEDVVKGFCDSTGPAQFEEAGCMVCGELTLLTKMTGKHLLKDNIDLLIAPEVTRVERRDRLEPLRHIQGPVLANGCRKVCNYCVAAISQGVVPDNALSAGLWLGDIPDPLRDLRFAEKLLISRVRHNCCVGRVASGGHKLLANAVMFASPMPKIYNALPPPKDDLDDILAVIFTGPCKPTAEELARSPFLVRRKKVRAALDWLKLNHVDYLDIHIDTGALESYPESGIPVSIEYSVSTTNKVQESASVHEMNGEDGTSEGSCPFAVHGLTEHSFEAMTMTKLKTVALNYLNRGGKMLAVGHSEQKESIYDNPHLYPSMFPWLFPYGMGGIGMGRLSVDHHVRHLLLYHDKRFQIDSEFPLIAFNHQQIKRSTSGSFMFVRNKKFEDVKRRLMTIDTSVLSDLSSRMSVPGSVVLPATDSETACFELLKDMDVFGGQLSGSLTSKKNMRSQLWSLMTHLGAPSWYITISPADTKHPICIYLAGSSEKFKPSISGHDDQLRAVTNNPVAGARFFNFMVNNFVKHVLGVSNGHDGIYGPTSAYYGTVEQQGRLTLHLHLLLWIRGSLSPAEIRKRLDDPDGLFRKALIVYLEGTYTGDFLTGSKDDVKRRVDGEEKVQGYRDPTRTIPEKPTSRCKNKCDMCAKCLANQTWWSKFRKTVDDLVLRSNVHTCTNNKDLSGQIKKSKTFGGCINIWGACKARFPRATYPTTTVDDTGHITMKKNESSINTYTSVLTYLTRCNTDVCSLLSGTAIKAVIAYVTDYVTKSALKTHVVFSTICSVFERNKEMLQGSLEQNEKARRIMNKIVNSVAAKMEIGSPMACLYLLGHPDHYTSHHFFPYSWKPFVHETRKCFSSSADEHDDDFVSVRKWRGRFIGVSPVLDYVYRPREYDDMSLYDWMRLSRKARVKSMKQCAEEELDDDIPSGDGDDDEDGNESDGASVTTNGDVEELGDDTSVHSHKRPRSPYDEHDSRKRKTPRLLGGAPASYGYKYLEGHPLRDTHQVLCVEPREDLVPDLVGGSLPRPDTGDPDYHAATMLTLFKPWRNGRDLKSDADTWENAYKVYVPTERQTEILKNMNVRHECLDARDNYSAELKKGAGPIISTYWSSAENMVDLDDELMVQRTLESLSGDDGYDESTFSVGQTGIDQDKQQVSMRIRLQQAGWEGELSSEDRIRMRQGETNPDPCELPSRESTTWRTLVDHEKQNVLDRKRMYMRVAPKDADGVQNPLNPYYTPDYVKVVKNSYLSKNYCADLKGFQRMSDTQVKDEKLNEEQERAFRIITNHSTVAVQQQQLLMYIAGMGGTGKTKVINTVIESFRLRDQQYRVLVVAPTGTAAALLGGCTYQSLLGMRESGGSDRITERTLSIIREKLEGVDYIFFDEVSMLSKRDMTKIHTRLCLALNDSVRPFGGMNMIFAGDFAQLPPVIGKESASLYGASNVTGAASLAVQEGALGRSIWHQVNVVVILRKNMRQQTQTPEDAKLRTALENMRYKCCTTKDLVFLRTLVARGKAGGPQLSSVRFRHHAIITARNLSKDEVNSRGCRRFAEDIGHKLHSFYSIDTLSGSRPHEEEKPVLGRRKKKIIRLAKITDDIRNLLWNRPCASTEKLVSGRLDICLNMPVMIRSNAPTELCITNGQEGTVAGWSDRIGPHGKPILDVLFVRLKNPPQRIQIADLPVGVVPIIRTNTPTLFTAPSGHSFRICREQVQVLPNFAMTDYASQGKTREKNLVDLQHCDTHQSYYTCLSRSASAANTAIIGGFDSDNITGGCSGWLRQEFRHIEILNDITRLRYIDKLPVTICGDRRKSLIQQYQQWKGIGYVPPAVHKALAWIPEDLSLELESNIEDEALSPSLPSDGNLDLHAQRDTVPARLQGTTWNPVDWSCAYDSSFTILYKLWLTNPGLWSALMGGWNPYLERLTTGFRGVLQGQTTLNFARDVVRSALHRVSPASYPYGQTPISVVELLSDLCRTSRDVIRTFLVCPMCNNTFGDAVPEQIAVLHATSETPKSVKVWVDHHTHSTHHRCPLGCQSGLVYRSLWQTAPPLVVFDLSRRSDIAMDTRITLTVQGHTVPAAYNLVGVVYHGSDHFTCRMIEGSSVLYHDGASDPYAYFEGNVGSVSLYQAKYGRKAICAVYAASSG